MSWYSSITDWAQKLDAKWLSAQALGKTFQQFACEEMQGHSFHQNFDLTQAVKEILELDRYPEQVNPMSVFGEPPITLYWSQDKSFYLDLYIWVNSQTAIHQHAFEGAFSVLSGQSLESLYDFIPGEPMGQAFWGELKTKDLRLLHPGDVRPIIFRDGTIHRVLHLAKPTASLVLRTGKISVPVLQYNYDYGCLATHGFPAGDVKSKLRVIQWYLDQGLLPSYSMIQPLLDTGDLWRILAQYEHSISLIKKISILHHDEKLIAGMQRQAQFQYLLPLLSTLEDRLLFSVYEHFDGEEWTDWIEKHLHQSPETARKKLQAALEATAGFTEASKTSVLLKKLFA